ncbi:MAG: metal-dependent hydrolase [Deltaproteobacteria bacterium]|nr:metal-dependent hydrolase [Deltaproteobacteria bacterium]
MKRVALLLAFALSSSGALAADKKDIKVTWLGHAAFEVTSSGGTTLLLDPFIKDNPATPAGRKDLSKYKPAAILVTHSHPDHAADAVEIAKATGAKVVGTFEYVSALQIPDAQKVGGNVGGTFKVGDVTIHMVPAMHSSEPNGRPVGYVLRFADGRSLYHCGDTWIFGDMALIQELYRPNVLLLNVGGGPFTQDPATAALAVKKYFQPDVIVPMHFGTFGALAQQADVEAAFKGDKRLKVLKPGDTASL